jgi:TPP-dependent pyruvate/acetoin dehydrogenase alpha subunit
LLGTGQIAVAFFGDGAINRGAFHEALNMAAIWSLPVLYVCEDNKWALSVPTSYSIPVADLSARAASYGFPGVNVDGNDVLAVYEAAFAAAKRARDGEGPTLLVCSTWRQKGHEEGDAQTYRDKAEIETALANDPIPRYRSYLLRQGLASEEELSLIEAEVSKEIEAAVEFADQSPYPAPEEALHDVFVKE